MFPLTVKEFLKGMTFHQGYKFFKGLLGLRLLKLWTDWSDFLFLTKEPYWALSAPNRLVVGNFSHALAVQRR